MNSKHDDRIWELLETWRRPEIRDDFTRRVIAEVRDQGKPGLLMTFLPSREVVRPVLALAACLAISVIGYAVWSARDGAQPSKQAAEVEALYHWDDLVGEKSSLEELELDELDMVLFGAGS